jgi:hypothetical protein
MPMRTRWELDISIEDDRVDHRSTHQPPPAPKRRRTDAREDRLAGFAAAASLQISPSGASSPMSPTSACELIQAAFRGFRVRREVARLRPSSASSSYQGGGDATLDDVEGIAIAEEITIAEDDGEPCFIKDLVRLAVSGPGEEDELDSALEESSELESSADSSTSNSLSQMVAAVAAHSRKEATEGQEQDPLRDSACAMCSICLGPMASRRRDKAGKAPEAPPPAMSVTTLECSHRYHRKCLLAWCRQQAPGTCPQCRELVKVRRRPTQQRGAPSLNKASAGPLVNAVWR